jgi:PAS domain S-box-containing protein
VGWSAHGGLIGQVTATGRPAAVPDIHRTPDAAQAPDRVARRAAHVVCLPAIEHGRTVGALYVAFATWVTRCRASGLDVLALLAAHVAAAYTNALEHAEVTRARARQQALIDASADGMALLDGAGIVRSWNAAAEALTGVSRDVAVGAPPRLEVGAPGVGRRPAAAERAVGGDRRVAGARDRRDGRRLPRHHRAEAARGGARALPRHDDPRAADAADRRPRGSPARCCSAGTT